MADTYDVTHDERLAAMQAEYQRTTGALAEASKRVQDLTTMMKQQEGYMAALRDIGAKVEEEEVVEE
tara:strand:- start:1702 stop:1902 length:201 start_codon:yes stop_codon:yes gene_type:complete